MKGPQKRAKLIGIALTVIGSIAWTNSILSFVLSSRLAINAEMVLLYAGLALMRPGKHKVAHVLSILFLAGIVVLLIPITAFTVSPHISVSILGENFDPTSEIALGFIVLITGSYIATLGWLIALLKKDLRFESDQRP